MVFGIVAKARSRRNCWQVGAVAGRGHMRPGGGLGVGSCEEVRTVAADDILAGVEELRWRRKIDHDDEMRQLYETTKTG